MILCRPKKWSNFKTNAVMEPWIATFFVWVAGLGIHTNFDEPPALIPEPQIVEWDGVREKQPQYCFVLPPEGSKTSQHLCGIGDIIVIRRDHYFSHEPFPFVKYSRIPWHLIGPLPRTKEQPGDFACEPERVIKLSYQVGDTYLEWQSAWGGTIPLKSVFAQNPRTAACALNYTHVDTARLIHARVAFNAPGRANRQYGGIALAGQLDVFDGAVLVKNSPAPAPVWQQRGKFRQRKAAWHDEAPYNGEDFYWTHPPVELSLKAALNKFLLRVPCGCAGQQSDFTFVPVKLDEKNQRWIEGETVCFAFQPE